MKGKLLAAIVACGLLAAPMALAKEYYGEGQRTYKGYVKKRDERARHNSATFLLTDKNGNVIMSKNSSFPGQQDPVSVFHSYDPGYKHGLKKEALACLEKAAKDHSLIELSGNWMIMGEGTEGFLEPTVQCRAAKLS